MRWSFFLVEHVFSFVCFFFCLSTCFCVMNLILSCSNWQWKPRPYIFFVYKSVCEMCSWSTLNDPEFRKNVCVQDATLFFAISKIVDWLNCTCTSLLGQCSCCCCSNIIVVVVVVVVVVFVIVVVAVVVAVVLFFTCKTQALKPILNSEIRLNNLKTGHKPNWSKKFRSLQCYSSEC